MQACRTLESPEALGCLPNTSALSLDAEVAASGLVSLTLYAAVVGAAIRGQTQVVRTTGYVSHYGRA